MATEAGGMVIGHAVAHLAAGVIAVPIFRKLGLGAVLGYLAAGVAVGPFTEAQLQSVVRRKGGAEAPSTV